MTYVITRVCVGTKDASCVEVCPVDCICSDEESKQYFINPDDCVDCGACVETCPVEAIYPEDEVPAEYMTSVEVNAEYFR